MIFPLPKKHPTTHPTTSKPSCHHPVGLHALSWLGLTFCLLNTMVAIAQVDQRRAPSTTFDGDNGDVPPGAIDPDTGTLKIDIDIEPPGPERLFYALGSQRQTLIRIRTELSDSIRGLVLPGPVDPFDRENANTLGLLWRQSDKGEGGLALDPNAPPELVLQVKNNQGIFPVGALPEVAIHAERILYSETSGGQDISNMIVAIDVQLGNNNNHFGLVVRADDPTPTRDQTQTRGPIDRNTFYMITTTADSVTLEKRQAGQRLAWPDGQQEKTESVSPLTSFNLTVEAFGNSIRVYRNGELVLEAEDPEPLAGNYAGIVGLVAAGVPVRFDNFIARAFYGNFQPRQYALSVRRYTGLSVDYHPLYFEHVALERYGHHMGNFAQPFISHTLFYADFFLLPYSVVKTPLWRWRSGAPYALPGDIVLPFRAVPPEKDLKALAAQTAVVALSFSLLP